MKSFFFRLGIYLQRQPAWFLLPIYLVWCSTFLFVSKVYNLHKISLQIEEKRFPGEALVDYIFSIIIFCIFSYASYLIFYFSSLILSAINSLIVFIIFHFLFLLFLPTEFYTPLMMEIILNLVFNVLILSKFKDKNRNIIFMAIIPIALFSPLFFGQTIQYGNYNSKIELYISFLILSSLFLSWKTILKFFSNYKTLLNSKMKVFIQVVLLAALITSLLFKMNFALSLSASFYITLTIQLFYYKRYTKLNWF